jgi:hypothetical protein
MTKLAFENVHNHQCTLPTTEPMLDARLYSLLYADTTLAICHIHGSPQPPGFAYTTWSSSRRMVVVTSYFKINICFPAFLNWHRIPFHGTQRTKTAWSWFARKDFTNNSIAFYFGAKQWRIGCNRCIGLGLFMFTVP